jgi:hypothetical protein
MTLPIITPGRPDRKADLFGLFASSGINFVSVTVAVDIMDFTLTMQSIANDIETFEAFVASRPHMYPAEGNLKETTG